MYIGNGGAIRCILEMAVQLDVYWKIIDTSEITKFYGIINTSRITKTYIIKNSYRIINA